MERHNLAFAIYFASTKTRAVCRHNPVLLDYCDRLQWPCLNAIIPLHPKTFLLPSPAHSFPSSSLLARSPLPKTPPSMSRASKVAGRVPAFLPKEGAISTQLRSTPPCSPMDSSHLLLVQMRGDAFREMCVHILLLRSVRGKRQRGASQQPVREDLGPWFALRVSRLM